MSLTPPSPLLPPLPLEKYIFFALPSMNGPLPTELKFRENTEFGISFFHLLVNEITVNKGFSSAVCWYLLANKVCFCCRYEARSHVDREGTISPYAKNMGVSAIVSTAIVLNAHITSNFVW